jgi:hypothetical protein
MSRNIIFVLNTALYDQLRMKCTVSTSIKKLTKDFPNSTDSTKYLCLVHGEMNKEFWSENLRGTYG